MAGPTRPARLVLAADQPQFTVQLDDTPDLPPVSWSTIGQSAPSLLTTPPGTPPKADVVVFTWATAEWAALQHVFCASDTAMPYGARDTSTWTGWERYTADLPAGAPDDWGFWGQYRLVQCGDARVLLFKSNTHLDWPGQTYLTDLVHQLVAQVEPNLVLSMGTAGGAVVTDHLGTIRAVSAGTLYEGSSPAAEWPVYRNDWSTAGTVLAGGEVTELFFPVPTTAADLQALASQFNQANHSAYSLSELDPDGLNGADPIPQWHDQTGGATSLLTTSTFVVGTTSGDYGTYACIEMDDAVVGQACLALNTAFGFIRNVSDPVQNAALPPKIQGAWGSAVYDAYGLYTSVNSALAAWAACVSAPAG